MSDATTIGLLEAAGTELYRGNTFRITGLPTDAGRRAVRQRQQQVVAALEMGVDDDLGDFGAASPEEVRAAFDRILGDPRRRLVDELFWLWDAPDAACGCDRTLHREHDAAVRAHSAVLDRELLTDDPTDGDLHELTRLWSEAARLWKVVLRRAGCWDHIRRRIAELDDRQLDESVVDVLRDGAPAVLVAPLIELAAATNEPGRLADEARRWPAPSTVVDDRLEQAAETLYATVDAAMAEAAELLGAGNIEQAASAVLGRAVPVLRRLTGLVPPVRHRRTATARDGAAIALNNCASELFDRLGPDGARQARDWFAVARELASAPDTVRAIEENSTGLDEIVKLIETVRARVAELVALGRRDLAKSMLRNARRQLRDMPGTADIDEMLAVLGGRRPAPSRPAPSTTGLDHDHL